MCPPETQQMADLADGAAARERQRNARLKTTETVTLEGALTLDDLRALVDRTAGWPGAVRLEFHESKHHPGEPGPGEPDRITIRNS